MRKSAQKLPSQRQLKVATQIRHVIAMALLQQNKFHSSDIRFDLITVTEVRISPDLRDAAIYVSLSKELDSERVLKALYEMRYLFKKEIAKSLVLKYMPKLKFYVDNTLDAAEKIASLLARSNVHEVSSKDDDA